VRELGELETPLALTNTLSIFNVAHGVADYVLNLEGNENVRSVNPVVGETNDGYLNNIRARVVTSEDVYSAIDAAKSGPVAEGSVGAGTGTRALGFKAGIGTSSRRLPVNRGGYTVGVLVQSNFGGILTVDGAPVGEELGNHYMSGDVPYEVSLGAKMNNGFHGQFDQKLFGTGESTSSPDDGYDYDVDGSIMIVVATDAPLTSRNLERLAKRAMLGVARTGGFASNGSGDYVIAFSTHEDVLRDIDSDDDIIERSELANSAMSPLFLATVEATEEAILNSLFMAETMTGHDGSSMDALPLDDVMEILKRYGVVDQ
jgi:D-aminopeptidase